MILEEKINDLKEEILFLRKDSSDKSLMINNLLNITKKNMMIEPECKTSDNDIPDIPDVSALPENKPRYERNFIPFNRRSNILDELMATPIKKTKHIYESFPCFDENNGAEEVLPSTAQSRLFSKY